MVSRELLRRRLLGRDNPISENIAADVPVSETMRSVIAREMGLDNPLAESISDLASGQTQQVQEQGSLMPEAQLVDRLRAFRERRRGLTPSNELTKIEAATEKASKSGSKLRPLKMKDGTFGLFDPISGLTFRQDGSVIHNPKFFRKDADDVMKETAARVKAKKDAGVLDTTFSKRLDKTKKDTIGLIKEDREQFRSARNALALARSKGNVMSQAVLLNMVPKITENRATDEDRRFVLELPGRLVNIQESIAQSTDPQFIKRKTEEANGLFERMLGIADQSLRFQISNQATSIAGGDDDKLEAALERLSGILPGSPVTLEESKLIQAKLRRNQLLRKRDRGAK